MDEKQEEKILKFFYYLLSTFIALFAFVFSKYLENSNPLLLIPISIYGVLISITVLYISTIIFKPKFFMKIKYRDDLIIFILVLIGLSSAFIGLWIYSVT